MITLLDKQGKEIKDGKNKIRSWPEWHFFYSEVYYSDQAVTIQTDQNNVRFTGHDIFLCTGTPERRFSPVVRTLAYHAARPGSIPGLGGENY